MAWVLIEPSCGGTQVPVSGDEDVPEGATLFSFAVSASDADFQYTVFPNWNTTIWEVSKTSSVITVEFGTPAIAGAKIHWMLMGL